MGPHGPEHAWQQVVGLGQRDPPDLGRLGRPSNPHRGSLHRLGRHVRERLVGLRVEALANDPSPAHLKAFTQLQGQGQPILLQSPRGDEAELLIRVKMGELHDQLRAQIRAELVQTVSRSMRLRPVARPRTGRR